MSFSTSKQHTGLFFRDNYYKIREIENTHLAFVSWRAKTVKIPFMLASVTRARMEELVIWKKGTEATFGEKSLSVS